MCGFVLAYVKKPNRRLPADRLDAMDRAIAHRGPDEHGQLNLEHVSVGHRRLAIIDLVGGKQPMFSADKRYLLTYNGEIYNFKEIKRELESLGHIFHETGDTEVLLVAWQVWGQACLQRLNGMFAFVIYDSVANTVFAVRDRFGEKPLYYAERDDAIYFASELKSLVSAGLTDKQIDPSALHSYFTLGYVTGAHSIFRDVQRLRPGHLVVATAGRCSAQQAWWRPPAHSDELDDPEFVASRTINLLRDSVAMRLIADVDVGFFLSGGVDSSVIVALAAEVATNRLETFSIGFDDPEIDERPYARYVAQRFGTKHHEFVVTSKNLDVLERIAWHADEPFADPAALPTWFLAELTHQHVKVALSGDGGDEVFAGYDVYRGHALSEAARKVPRIFRRMTTAALLEASRISGKGRWSRLARNLADADISYPERFIAKQQQVFRSGFFRQHSPFLAKIEFSAVREEFASLCDAPNAPLAEMAWWQQTTSLPDDMLHKVDRMTMAHSLEVRTPFLDHGLVELLNRTSFHAKLKDGQPKYVLREAAAQLLPKAFLARRKQGFVVPLNRWFRGNLVQFARDELLSPNAINRQIFSPGVVEGVLAEHENGRGAQDKALWALLMFEQWARAYKIDPKSLAAVS